MSLRKKIFTVILFVIFLFTPFIVVVMLDENVLYDLLEDVNQDYLNVPIENNFFVCEYFDDKLIFHDHILDLSKLNLDGYISGGYSICDDKIYLTTNTENGNKKLFKIIEMDYYGDKQSVIYTDYYNFSLGSCAYDKVIYYGEKSINGEKKDIFGYDLKSKKYFGLIDSEFSDYQSYKNALCDESNPFRLLKGILFDSYVEIVKKGKYDIVYMRTEDIKRIDSFVLNQADYGEKITSRKKWWFSKPLWIDNHLFIRCIIQTKESQKSAKLYFNVIYEYDFINDILKFKFYFISNDVGVSIYID